MSFNVFSNHYRQNYAKYFGCWGEGMAAALGKKMKKGKGKREKIARVKRP